MVSSNCSTCVLQVKGNTQRPVTADAATFAFHGAYAAVEEAIFCCPAAYKAADASVSIFSRPIRPLAAFIPYTAWQS